MDALNADETVGVGEQLTQYLAPDVISYRKGEGGKMLAYLEGHEVLTLLNSIFGWHRWNSKVVRTDVDYATETSPGKWSVGIAVTVQLTVLVEDRGGRREVSHQDIGYGTMDNGPGRGKAMEKCRKEGMTDGIKRVARQLGNATGGCLYNTEYRERVKKVKGPMTRIDFVESELRWKPMNKRKRCMMAQESAMVVERQGGAGGAEEDSDDYGEDDESGWLNEVDEVFSV
jgi:DNA recombination protein Rad52